MNNTSKIYKHLDSKYNYILVTGINTNPVNRILNNKIIGNLFQESIYWVLINSGLYDEIVMNDKINLTDVKIEKNGMDIKARRSGVEKIQLEATCLADSSYWCPRKIERTRNNIKRSSAELNIIFTTFLDSVYPEQFKDLNVQFIELGYQPLPKPFYEFAKKINRDEGRRPFTLEVLKDINSTLVNFIIDYRNEQVRKYLNQKPNKPNLSLFFRNILSIYDINKPNVDNGEILFPCAEEDYYFLSHDNIDPDEDDTFSDLMFLDSLLNPRKKNKRRDAI